jgi:PhnB protein
MKLTTYVNFPGNCREALQFYEKHLGGKIVMMMTFDQMPDPKQIPPGFDKYIAHGQRRTPGTRSAHAQRLPVVKR